MRVLGNDSKQNILGLRSVEERVLKTPHSRKEVSYSECDKVYEIFPSNRSILALNCVS